MSKAQRGKQKAKSQIRNTHHVIPPSSEAKGRNTRLVFALIAILAAIPFTLGKYFEFNSPDPFDSGANVYSAKHVLDGAEIGVEEKPSAMIATLLVNIAGVWLCGFNETGPKLIQTIIQAAALCLMFIAMYKLFGKLPAAVGVIIASVYLSAPLIAKFGNDKTQFLTAFMVLGVSCFVLRQLENKWWWAVLAGGFLSWAPLFKPVGASAIAAIGLFIILQPFLKNRTPKQTGLDILLLLAGAAAAIGPLYIWIIGWNVQMSLPYSFVWDVLQGILPAGGGSGQAKGTVAYVAGGRKLVSFSQQWPRVLRYYGLLILPITLAAGAIIARIIRMPLRLKVENRDTQYTIRNTQYDRFVLLFAVWWILDMAFVWISPRSYEQYYLPLNASAAMLGGYLIALYRNKFRSTIYKTRFSMSWHIFFGIEKSPHSGADYGRKRRGYIQKLNEVSKRRKNNLKGPWEVVGEYIRKRSEPTARIYVWGWYPGIYVAAQRLSSASKASCIPRPTPQKLQELIATLMTEFERQPPEFIVDSRKRHIPTERPPYELWPIVPKGFMGAKNTTFLPSNKNAIAQYDKQWSDWLRKNFDEDEAIRYQALKPFREFVMKNYEIVKPIQRFWPHVVFRLKKTTLN
jgi:hypothetical protein